MIDLSIQILFRSIGHPSPKAVSPQPQWGSWSGAGPQAAFYFWFAVFLRKTYAQLTRRNIRSMGRRLLRTGQIGVSSGEDMAHGVGGDPRSRTLSILLTGLGQPHRIKNSSSPRLVEEEPEPDKAGFTPEFLTYTGCTLAVSCYACPKLRLCYRQRKLYHPFFRLSIRVR